MKIQFVNLVHELNRAYPSYNISMPPLCLEVLAELTPKDIEVSLLDEQCDELNFEGDVFAFTLATQLAPKVYHYADILRKQGKKVILGGYHPTILPDEALKHADCVVVGEAEGVWPKICEDLKKGSLKKKYSSRDSDLSMSPVLTRKLFKEKNYHVKNTIMLTRGCPYQCTFCVSSKILGGYRTRPLDKIEEELKYLDTRKIICLVDDHPFHDEKFNDGLFALFKKHKIKWVTQITADRFCDKEFMKKAADAGCIAVLVGVESLNPKNNESILKYQNLSKNVAEAIRHCEKIGVSSGALLLFGLDYDTEDSIKETVEEIRKMGFGFFNICLLRVYPGTVIYEQMLKEGRIEKEWWISDKDYNHNGKLPGYMGIYYTPKSIDAKRLQELCLWSYIRLNSTLDPMMYKIMLKNIMRGNFSFAGKLFMGRFYLTHQIRKLRRELNRKDDS